MLKQSLNEVSIRLDSGFVAPEDTYITYSSKGFGIRCSTAGDFKATLESFEAFVYSSTVVDLLKKSFRAKHIRAHKSGSRPVFMDPRNMAPGMISGTLRERHRVALLKQDFEQQLKTMPSDMAAFHREKCYSTGIEMRKKVRTKVVKMNRQSFNRLGNLSNTEESEDEDEDEEEKHGPRYLEYLDEYSVSAVSADELLHDQDPFNEKLNDPPLGNMGSQGYSGPYGVRNHGSQCLSTHTISLYNLHDDDSQTSLATVLQGEASAEDNLQPQSTGFHDNADDADKIRLSGGPKYPCMCDSVCICAILCGAEARRNCACRENSLFWRIAQRLNIDESTHSIKEVEQGAARTPGQDSIAAMTSSDNDSQHQFNRHPAVEKAHAPTNHTSHKHHSFVADTPIAVNELCSESQAPLGREPDDIRDDALMKALFGGSLSIWAVTLPNGERVKDWGCEWYEQMRADMDAHRQRYEPDPDWYFPPGADYGRLDSRRIYDQLTLRRRVFDKTIGNITGKKTMCKPLKLREEYRIQNDAVDPAPEGPRSRKQSLMFSLFSSRLSRRAESQKGLVSASQRKSD